MRGQRLQEKARQGMRWCKQPWEACRSLSAPPSIVSCLKTGLEPDDVQWPPGADIPMLKAWTPKA